MLLPCLHLLLLYLGSPESSEISRYSCEVLLKIYENFLVCVFEKRHFSVFCRVGRKIVYHLVCLPSFSYFFFLFFLTVHFLAYLCEYDEG